MDGSMTKVLITGCAGFIGSHLATQLNSKGYDVVGLDNFNDYYDPALKREREHRLLLDEGIIIHKVDLRDVFGTFYHMRSIKPDVVIHLAAYAGVRHSMDAPGEYVENNVVGTHNLVEACSKVGIDKVIFASTSCVMAGNSLPWNERDPIGHQLNPYGYTKACNESQFLASTIPHTVGLRFFTVYGPWGRPDMALFDFTQKIVAGKEIELFNFGNMVRDFTYVADIVQGVELVLQTVENPKEDSTKEIYNIGYGKQVQLLDFVKSIENHLGMTAKKKFVPKHPADTIETWSDTSKLQKLGYKPKTSIDEGVGHFIDWYKDYYGVNT
jgi:UDP-glucuronate 4-epimerase